MPFATITVETEDGATHREHHRIEGDAFSLWVQREYWRATGAPPGKDALREALGLAKARGLFDGKPHRTWIRIGRHGEKLYLDLTDDQWRVIEIDAEGWRLCTDPPVRFRRSGGEQPLPMPTDPDDPLAMGVEMTLARLGSIIRLQRSCLTAAPMRSRKARRWASSARFMS